MDRRFDYTQKILLAAEFADALQRLEGLPAYSVFKRLSIPEVVRAVERMGAAPPAGGKFESLLDQRMGYWERAVPEGKSCFVHYAIGTDSVINPAFERLNADRFVTMGVYHVEPQCSCYPFSFPSGLTPDNWRLGETFSLTDQSIFWFNFFPAQPYLFEKTFVVWAAFQLARMKGRGENNQLVASDGLDRLVANSVSDFVQVNLNRFTDLQGFLASAREAGEQTFTEEGDYTWYGMLLRKV